MAKHLWFERDRQIYHLGSAALMCTAQAMSVANAPEGMLCCLRGEKYQKGGSCHLAIDSSLPNKWQGRLSGQGEGKEKAGRGETG